MSQAFGAASQIKSYTFTDFCSTLLGYTTPITTQYVPVTTTEDVSVTVTEGTLTSGTTDTYTTVPTTITITSADSNWQRLRARSENVAPLTTPAPLANYSDSAVSQACSWFAYPVNTTSTVTATTTDTAYTTIYITVPEATVPATTNVITETSTSTINSCEPTAPAQLIKNPSFECYKAGWDVDYNGAVLYWGPNGTATPELDASAAAYVESQNTGASGAGQSSTGAPSSGSGSSDSTVQEARRLALRQDDGSESSQTHPDSLYTPLEPAYDGSTYVRLSPAWSTDPNAEDAVLGQVIDNLDAGDYWMSYKYRVPTYALNNDACALNVYVNGIYVMGPGISDLVDPTDGWQAAGGFFSIPDSMAGPQYLVIDFFCPPLSDSKVKRQDSGDSAAETGSYPDGSAYTTPDPMYPLLDIDYVRMGVDDGGWAQYRGAASEDDANAATQSADIAAALAENGSGSSEDGSDGSDGSETEK